MKNLFLNILMLSVILSACDSGNNKETAHTEGKDTSAQAAESRHAEPVLDTAGRMEKNGIKLTPLIGTPEFADASLEVSSPEENAKLKSGEVTFKYEVKNYELKKQTDTATCHQCNNSKDGQHIHLILNNMPYIAVYDTEHKEKLKDGHYVALSFLSRSFHESIKQFQAFDLRQFSVGNAPATQVDLTKPLLFYSRPKGEYNGKYAKRILLDYYLVNQAEGNKVRATINGNEFMLDKWQPFIIEGLPMGESVIKLELLDKDGKLVDSPYNSVERKITLKEENPS